MKYLIYVFFMLLASSAAAFDDVADIHALEQQWDAANLHGDAAALDKVLASDFFLTGDDERCMRRRK